MNYSILSVSWIFYKKSLKNSKKLSDYVQVAKDQSRNLRRCLPQNFTDEYGQNISTVVVVGSHAYLGISYFVLKMTLS